MARLPTFDNVDMNDPEQMFQPLMVELPFTAVQNFTPPPDMRKQWSQRWYDGGLRYHDELRVIKLVAPYRGPDHYLNGTSDWIGRDEPERDKFEVADLSKFTVDENKIHAEQLRYLGVVPGQELEPVDTASEINGELFDPRKHTPSTVNGYLMACSAAEKRRVIAAEMASGKPRQQILNKHRGV